MVLVNAHQRGVDLGDATVSAGLGPMANAYNALLNDGDVLKSKEKDNFVKLFASYVNGSGAKVPDTDVTYKSLLDGVPAVLASGKLPATLPSAGQTQAAPAEEPPKKKKEPKPLPKEYI